MPTNYTRTVAWTGANSGAGANYTWIDVSNAEAAGWITRVEDPNTADAWVFQIADNTASNAVLRTAVYRVQHYTYSDGADANTFDEFTITQHTSGTVTVTTNATAATTLATAATTTPTGATAATTTPTGATAATTAPTAATAATTAPTAATAATTIATTIAATTTVGGGDPSADYTVGPGWTDATAATTAPTNATAATTLATTVAPTPATNFATNQPLTITWDGSTINDAGMGAGYQENLTANSAYPGDDFQNYGNTSSGRGSGETLNAGMIYWTSDAAGNVGIGEPAWVQNVNIHGGTGTSPSNWGDGSNAPNEFGGISFVLAAWGNGIQQ